MNVNFGLPSVSGQDRESFTKTPISVLLLELTSWERFEQMERISTMEILSSNV